MKKLLVSIIIPTYRDWQRLSFCLQALEDQSFANELFEIIVVNNDPGDSTPSWLKIPSNCKIIKEGKPGSYAARNAAIKISGAKILGFTDSDCIPKKDWIKNAVRVLEENPGAKRIGGAIELFYKKDEPSKVELYDKVFAFPQEAYVNSGNAVTANMFTYKSVFEKLGFFDENLMSGGDYQWGKLAFKNGVPIVYAPNAIVGHPARPTIKELVVKAKRVGKGQAKFKKPTKKGFLELSINFLKLFKPRLWEIKIILKKEKNTSLFKKVYLILLRHYVVGVGDFTRMMNEKKIQARS